MNNEESNGTDPPYLHGIQVCDAVDVWARLIKLFEGKDSAKLRWELAGRRVTVIDLVLSVRIFCSENDIDYSNEEIILLAIVPEEQHDRLRELMLTLPEWFGSE